MADEASKRVFVSFSVTGDPPGRAFVRQLLSRLNQQTFEAWVYESSAGRIPAGASIAHACRSKIEECDLFCAFISDRSLGSPSVDMEVSHAVWLGTRRPLLLYPIVSTRRPIKEWPFSLRECVGYRGHSVVEHGCLDDVEPIVLDICTRLDITYCPPAPVLLRMPFARRVLQELRGHKAIGDADMSEFAKLQTRCELAVQHLEAGQFADSKRIVTWVLTELELSYGVVRPYFPRVILGVIFLAEAQRVPAAFVEAERLFSELVSESGPLLDANAHAGRGHALMGLGRHKEAIEAYRRAQECLVSPDPALFYSLIRSHVQAGLEVPSQLLSSILVEIEAGVVSRTPGDRDKVASVLALAEAYRGDLAAALHAWREIGDPSEVRPELVTDACHWLCVRGQENSDARFARTALLMVREARAALHLEPDFVLCQLEHVEARICAELGDEIRARAVMKRLVERFPLNPVLGVDAAIFAVCAGDERSALESCRKVADLSDASACLPPLSAPQFEYAVGQANWLLGREAEAAECFRRSGYGSTRWFGHCVPHQLGAATSRLKRREGQSLLATWTQ